jgi:hypothetical protein
VLILLDPSVMSGEYRGVINHDLTTMKFGITMFNVKTLHLVQY